MKSYFPLFILLLCWSCVQETPPAPAKSDGKLLTLLPASHTGIDFENTIQEDAQNNIGFFDYYYNGGGVAVGDINNDGLADVLFTGNMVPNKLYLNKGNLSFEDITEKSGIAGKQWSTGATMGDLNNDGYLDIYICNSGPTQMISEKANLCYINNGNNTFTEKGAQMGIADRGNSIQAVFLDYDKDKDLDLFVMNHNELRTNTIDYHQWINTLSKEDMVRLSNSLYQNNGNGTFSNVSEFAGVQKAGFGLGLTASDLNHDGWVDIYVANDYFIPDFMFINNGNGTFEDKVNVRTAHTSFYSMGCDAADINNDGWVDLGIVDMAPKDHIRSKRLMPSMNVNEFRFLTNNQGYQDQFMFNAIQVNNGSGYFSEIGHYSGVAKTDWSWAALFADIDNDGHKDYIVTNGFKRDTKDNDLKNRVKKIASETSGAERQELVWQELQAAEQKPLANYVYQNQGDLRFVDKAAEWGFDAPSFSNGAAFADLDNDGDLDVVVNNVDAAAFVFQNNATQVNQNNYIQFQIKEGKLESMNAKITIHTADGIQYWETTPTRGYQSAMENTAHFGLGKTAAVEKVQIEWADQTETTIQNPAINQLHIIQKEKQAIADKAPENQAPAFLNISPQTGISYVHTENTFDDFEKEVLLPHSQSRLGPKVAVGDVNGDGFHDFYCGGAKGQAGILYLQHPQSGKFVPSQLAQPWQQQAASEDIGCLFFDADNDGDLDLYVASGGGGDVEGASNILLDRLYLNQNNGAFTYAFRNLPQIKLSSGNVKAADYDKDGDLDLLIGGRTTPGAYPKPTSSYLLENNGGFFKDVTAEKAPMLQNIGMVTDFVWTDFDGDSQTDLIIVGEWMPITMLKNSGGKFEDVSSTYLSDEMRGWWFSIAGFDIDKDGDQDYIIGNLGENNKFKPSNKKPLRVFGNDFDENGSLDIVLSVKYKEEFVPLRGKECSTEQMPFLEQKFPTFKSFAEAKLEDVYGEEKLEKAIKYEVESFTSIILRNEGNGKWKVSPLPYQAQFAPINAMVINDFNQDGLEDIVLGGNMMNTEVETTAYDAGKGLYLINRGNGVFETTLDWTKTGIFFQGDVKDLKMIAVTPEKRPAILVGNNNQGVELFIYLRERDML